jgi:CBS domain-containing protein
MVAVRPCAIRLQLVAVADVMAFRVVTVRPDDPVRVAITRMLEENVGSVAVCEGERLVGIFTERDVLRLAGEGPHFAEVAIEDVMTRQLITLSPDDDILDAARLMSERRIRHLPVLQGENLLGMIGIREVVRVLVERLWQKHDPEARERARELLDRASTPLSSERSGV